MNELQWPLTPQSFPEPDLNEGLPPYLVEAQRFSMEMIIRGYPLTEVLSHLVLTVERHAGGDAIAAILLLDEQGKLRNGAAPSLPDSYNNAIDGITATVGLGTCSEAAVLQKVVITPDIEASANWATIKHLPLGLGLKAAWSQPILGGDGRTLGTFGTYFKSCREPNALERQLVGVLAQTAALAIERHKTDLFRQQQERILATALHAAEMGSWKYSFATNIVELSPKAQELYGLPSRIWVHDEQGVADVLHPEDIPGMWQSVARCRELGGAGRYEVDYRVKHPQGGWRWLSVWGVVEYDQADPSQPQALIGASRDITDRMRQQEQLELMTQELSHRVKNAFALAQAMASQALRHDPDPVAFQERFMSQLGALSRAYGLLYDHQWKDAALRELLETVLEPFRPSDEAITLVGTDVHVGAGQATALCLLFHELAANATKHGALSRSTGQVKVVWHVENESSDDRLRIEWVERGGPPVSVPTKHGFGSKIIRASAMKLDGSVDQAFDREGMTCLISVAMPEPNSYHLRAS